jgi:hypothetical protein
MHSLTPSVPSDRAQCRPLVHGRRSPKYYVEAEGLLVKGEPSWESGGGKKSKKCFDPKDACAHCEPDLIDSPPKYLDGYCESAAMMTVTRTRGICLYLGPHPPHSPHTISPWPASCGPVCR